MPLSVRCNKMCNISHQMSINTEIGYFMIHFTDTFTAVE